MSASSFYFIPGGGMAAGCLLIVIILYLFVFKQEMKYNQSRHTLSLPLSLQSSLMSVCLSILPGPDLGWTLAGLEC